MTMFSPATQCGAFARLAMLFGMTSGRAVGTQLQGGTIGSGRSDDMLVAHGMGRRHGYVSLVAAIVLPGVAVAFLGLAAAGASSFLASDAPVHMQVAMGVSQACAAVAGSATMAPGPVCLDGAEAGALVGSGEPGDGSAVQW